MQLVIALFLLAAAGWVFLYSRWSTGSRSRRPPPPPGPPRLPILGNVFQVGKDPHKSLAQLARTYGPLMSIKLGRRLMVVVSSPEVAYEMMQKQGHVFSDRYIPDAMRVLGFDKLSIGMAPANSTRWKSLRRISREKLFSNQALQATQALRQQGLRKMIDHVSKHSDLRSPVNVGEAIFNTVCNLIFITFFSVGLNEFAAADRSVTLQKFKEHVNGFSRYIGLPNISDFFPVVAPLDLQGIRRKAGHHLGGLLEIVDHLVEQRLQERNNASSSSNDYQKKNDFLETLLDLMEGGNDEYEYLSIEQIKIYFVGLINAATHSTSATTEWAMTELLLNPDKLAKLKAEVKSIVGEKRIVEESDISRLPYLQAVIKEVLRYHPVAPLLVPRKSQEEAQVNGYTIPKDTQIIFNFWAIAMDPNIWKNPDQFEPERFLGNDIDYNGQHFELIPFGSGRRICSGVPLAGRTMPCMVATLCHNFDWKFEQEAESSKQFQREEVFGMGLGKKYPLKVLPITV